MKPSKKFMAMTLAMAATCLGCSGSSPSEPEAPQQPDSADTTATVQPVTQVMMTSLVPDDFFMPAARQGTVELFTYSSRDYAGSNAVTSKPAYVYLPNGYDPSQRYDIIYLIHGWTGRAQDYFATTSYPQLKNIFDHLIESGLTRPFIAVSPTWDKDNQAKGWGESVAQVRAFYQEYQNDLIPAIESHYSTYAEATNPEGILASREHRAVGGFSLGSITTWYIFEHTFDLQKWFLPMSGDNWHIEMYGGQTQPEATAEFLTTVVKASDYSDNFYVWYAVGTNDSRFPQTDNQARAMMQHPDTFNQSNFSYHQKAGGVHDIRAVWEFVYNALPFFFPPNSN